MSDKKSKFHTLMHFLFVKHVKLIIALLWCAFIVPVALFITAVLLTAAGVIGNESRMPNLEELDNPSMSLATEVYSSDGAVIGTFFRENRTKLQYRDLFPQDTTRMLQISGHSVPPIVAALIATEDMRFYSHSAIDFRSLARVGIKTLAMHRRSQGGGSTITQQLAKNLFKRTENGGISELATSKLQEWVVATKLEYKYTKEEIITMYLNLVDYGSNAVGIKSAAQTFFNKEPDELNIQEAAVLAGVVNATTRYSPVLNPENALKRRNLVLSRMATAGALTKAEADSLSGLPIILNYNPVSHNEGAATYFREMLRLTMTAKRPERSQFTNDWDYQQAVKEYDENPIYGWCLKNTRADGQHYDLYSDGLRIYTTIDSKMQAYAEEAMRKQMREEVQPKMDAQVKRTGSPFSKDRENLTKKAMRDCDRYRSMKRAGIDEAKIFDSMSNNKYHMRIFTFNGVRDTLMTPRDSVLHYKRIMRASFVAIEPQTGYVKAYIGGPNFRYFKYDNAKYGKRQIGSTVKPFIYTFAIDHLGLTPCTMVPNLQTSIETANGQAWSPKEAGKVDYDGVLHPLVWGLQRSRNNYSAWIMKQAKQPAAVANFLHNMGIHSYIDPVYALCLGSFESNVLELAGAYATFANEGVFNEPVFVTRIEDHQGNLLADFTTRSQDAISSETAYTMLQMMKRVITGGTGSRMVWKYGFRDMDIAGKTGTTNNNADAWFMCVTPRLVAGAWVGGDDNNVHLSSGGEGSVMALPIVGEFFTKVYNDPSLGISRSEKFKHPAVYHAIDCPDSLEPDDTYNQEDEFF